MLRSNGYIGTYMHICWECKDVKLFGGEVLDVTVPCSPIVLLLNDTTPLKVTCWKRRMLQLLNPVVLTHTLT